MKIMKIMIHRFSLFYFCYFHISFLRKKIFSWSSKIVFVFMMDHYDLYVKIALGEQKILSQNSYLLKSYF